MAEVRLTTAGQIVNEISGTTDLPQDDPFPTVRSHTTICRSGKDEATEELWPDIRRHLRSMARSSLLKHVVNSNQGTT